MNEINNDDIKMDKPNNSNDLENEVVKESDNIPKCEEKVYLDKKEDVAVDTEILENHIEKQNEDAQVSNNQEAQLEDKEEQSILNAQEESNEREEKTYLDEKEESIINNEINEVLENNDEISCDVNEVQEDNSQINNEANKELDNHEEVNIEDKEDSKINEDSEVIKDELNSKDGVNEYEEQIKDDILIYEENLLEYKKWVRNGEKLISNSEKAFDKINLVVKKFNEKISVKLAQLNDDDKKLIENRIKGINMINKMSKNTINNGTNKLLDAINQNFDSISIISDIDKKTEYEIRSVLNENYNNITHIESQKSSLTDIYFNFIEGNLLPILDGVESGISFVKNSNKEIIQNEILPVYVELEMCFGDLLSSTNVKKIELEPKAKIDFSYVEVLDIEDTEDINLDETIESVIRSGYEYLKDIYGVGHNHIIRQAQIVAYKYAK